MFSYMCLFTGGIHGRRSLLVCVGGRCTSVVSGPFRWAVGIPGPMSLPVSGGIPGPRFLLGVLPVIPTPPLDIPTPWTYPPPQTYSPLTPWTYSPRRTHPTGTPSTDIYWWPPKRAVRILLECFLVHFVCDLFVY